MKYIVYNHKTGRIVPDKPGPGHAETLKIQRERKPETKVTLHCGTCEKRNTFTWSTPVDLKSYLRGELNCACGALFPKPAASIRPIGHRGKAYRRSLALKNYFSLATPSAKPAARKEPRPLPKPAPRKPLSLRDKIRQRLAA